MSILLRRRRHSPGSLYAAAAVAALCLGGAVLFIAELLGTSPERRYAKLAVGDVRILEERIPVRAVRSSDPAVATTDLSASAGLLVRGLRGGHTEITFERADGKRFRYSIAVKGTEARRMPVNLVRLPRRNAQPVVRRPASLAEAQRRLAARRELEKKKKVEELREVKPNGQVVEIDPPAVAERPKNARFLAEFDSTTKKETQARNKSLRRGRPGPSSPLRPQPLPPSPRRPRSTPPLPKPPAPQRLAQPTSTHESIKPITSLKVPSLSKSNTAPIAKIPGQSAQPLATTPPKAEASPPKVAASPTPAATAPDGQQPPSPTEKPPAQPTQFASLPSVAGGAKEPAAAPGAEPDEPTPPSFALPPGHRIELAPSPEVLRQALGGGQGGGAGFPDKLGGVAEGDKTFLNTKEWKGASFFNRMKAAVAQKWNPGEVYSRRDPSGRQFGIKDRYTLVHVTLNGDGSLRNLRVLSPSGVDFLDEEAMGALEGAGPFPNPPPEVKDKDGLIRFSFGFYFEVSDRPLFRIFK